MIVTECAAIWDIIFSLCASIGSTVMPLDRDLPDKGEEEIIAGAAVDVFVGSTTNAVEINVDDDAS